MAKARQAREIGVPPPKSVLQLRIALKYIKPPIWRRVLVPNDWRLGDLHPLFVRVIGWQGYHMHSFRFGGGFKQEQYSTRQTAMECGPEIRDEDSFLLRQVIRRKGQVFTYEYDFGDGWLHEVKVEKILPFDPAADLPVCLAGDRACPPEDCGGLPGYANVLRVLAGARTQEDREFREWVGEYEPEHFDLNAVNRAIQTGTGSKRR